MSRLPQESKKSAKTELKVIEEVAKSAGIRKNFIQSYGPYRAKLSLDLIKKAGKKQSSKYVLITSITPMLHGEGKTTTAIGLSMALNRLKKKSIACIPQPSLSAIFGVKGAGTGGGLSQVLPGEDANLHLADDSHAVTYAHNLCAAYIDNSLYRGNPLDLDTDSIAWKRAVDINDRSLRNVNTSTGGKADGANRKTGFDIASSSELMAILTLSDNLNDMRQRIGRIIVGYTKKGRPVTCEDIKTAGAMAALLKNAIKPNILQTTGGNACFMHGGSISTISVGSSSLIADRIAMALCDYTITEGGFGAELGAEKFFDIKCRASGLMPNVAVLVCTARAFKMHSGDYEIAAGKPLPREITRENIFAIEKGLSNLEKEMENMNVFGVPVIVCINRFADDSDKEVSIIKRRATNCGASAVVVSEVYAKGAEGGLELAHAVVELSKLKPKFRFLYPINMPIKDKIKRIATTIYGASEIKFSELANKKALMLKKLKLDAMPVCIAKTHLSLSYNPKRKGRPHGFKLPITDIGVANGASYITAFSENVRTMRGLPKVPRGTKIDIDDEGKIKGLL
ncbi:MAG: formate--tetrahydrofolate ligase [Candidatus Omnitrophica bacterium]|nr:formate--tetrahydrofolate ligase [Candidatus Omnitrophota bacterium]